MVRDVAKALVPIAVMLAVAGTAAAGGLRKHAPPNLANAKVIWSGDFETGDLSQWWGPQAADANRIQVVPTNGVLGTQGKYAARFQVDSGDTNVAGSGSNGERADVLIRTSTTRASEGREQWWTWWTYFPRDAQFYSGSWNIFTSFHHTGDTGQVPVTFEVHNLAPKPPTLFLRANESPSEQGRRNFRLAKLQTAHWYHFLFHVRWSSDRKLGFIELWLDNDNVVPKTFRRTLYPGQGVYLKQGFYRGACACTSVVYINGTALLRPPVNWLGKNVARSRRPG